MHVGSQSWRNEPIQITFAAAKWLLLKNANANYNGDASCRADWNLGTAAFSVCRCCTLFQHVLVPIALATLITFLLSRLVTRLERWIGRIAAVLVTMIAMLREILRGGELGHRASSHRSR